MDHSGNETNQAERLKAARKAARMTQAHLAAAAGVSARTVRRAESGLPITDEVARALCAVLGIDVTRISEPAVEAAPVSGGPDHPLMDHDLHARHFAFRLFRWVGGAHPMMIVILFAPLIHLKDYTLIIAGLALVTMYVYPLLTGCNPRQAFDFLCGHRFANGDPVNLAGRLRVSREIFERGRRDRDAVKAA